MPYILIRGNLASYGHKNPWRVLVSGLKGGDIEQLKRFACGGYCDDSTIVYLQHPCVILSALEIIPQYLLATLDSIQCRAIHLIGDPELTDGLESAAQMIHLVFKSVLQVLGYKVVASSSTAVKQDYNEYMWTMRKEFAEPEPTILVERDNITNFSKEAMTLANCPTAKDDEV